MQNIKEKVFFEDGSWRGTNLYNLISPNDQLNFIEFVNSISKKIEIYYDDKSSDLNIDVIKGYFSEPVELRFSFYIHLFMSDNIYFTAHFFSNETIEIEIYPDLLNTENDIKNTLEYINKISKQFKQNMHITPENNAEYYLLKHNWKTGKFKLWDDWNDKYGNG